MPVKSSAIFTRDFFKFMADLERHNDRTWFNANKGRFEEDVQAPAVGFIAEVTPGLQEISPYVMGVAKPFGGSLMRIYRDTRFTRDKRPYHTHVGIHFSHARAGKRDPGMPGYFFRVDASGARLYGGVWHPEGPQVKAIRDRISKSPSAWKAARKPPVVMWGESLKRVPRGYDPGHPYAEDLRRKDFIGAVNFSKSQVASPRFIEVFFGAARKLAPMNAFVAKAMRVPW